LVGRTLRYAGLGLLAVAAWVLLAGEVGWTSKQVTAVWFEPLAKGGALMFVVGLGLCVLAPFARMLRRGHCVRCGARTERGQAYCLDHMRASLNEVQDRMRPKTEKTTRHGGTS
jgi:hypothetical protein